MKFVKKSNRLQPRVSLVLLDWEVRESFHLLDYLRRQNVSRDDFEVIIIEYYQKESQPLKIFEDQVDCYVLLEMPHSCYYHKHLMYNVGVALAHGDIVMIGDSDAMVRESFIKTIIDSFDRDRNIVYHIDQFRNVRRDFYPFNYPSFDEVLGEGCINNIGGKTTGVLDEEDPVHSRNFGACMCAKREDLIAIGGSDEDLSYLGHVCGPYDLTFRLMHFSRRLVWETEEYMMHTWHPGSDGVDNYSGPHDGRNMSLTALRALTSGKIKPLVENRAIRRLREGGDFDPERDVDLLIDPTYAQAFDRSRFGAAAAAATVSVKTNDRPQPLYAQYKGFDIYEFDAAFYAVPEAMGPVDLQDEKVRNARRVARAGSFGELKAVLDEYEPRLIESVGAFNVLQVGKRFVAVPQSLGPVYFYNAEERANPQVAWADSAVEAAEAARNQSATNPAIDSFAASFAAPRQPPSLAVRAVRRLWRMVGN